MKRKLVAKLMFGLVGVATVAGLRAELKDNPYAVIYQQNAFKLKDPPPPAPEKPPEPPPSPVEVLLTGISTLSGTPKVILQITDKSPGKGKAEFPSPLVAGDVQGRVEIVSIDAENGSVVIKIDNVEKTLTFEKDAPKAAGGPAPGPGSPAPPNPFLNPAGTVPIPQPFSQPGATPTAGAASGRFGVMVSGSSPVASVPAPASSGIIPAPTAGSVTMGGAPSSSVGGTPTIPSRPLRLTADGSSGSVVVGGSGGTVTPPRASMSREQIAARIEQLRAAQQDAIARGALQPGSVPPLPPTILTPPPTQ